MRARRGTRRGLRALAAGLAALALVLAPAALDGTRAAFSATTSNVGDELATRQLQPPSGLTVTQSCAAAPAVTRRASSTGTGTASVALPMPAGTTAGDFLLAHVAYHDGVQTLTAPSGWALVGQSTNSGSVTSAVFWKVAATGEPGAVFRHPNSGSAVLFAGGVTAFRGVRPVTPPFADAVGSSFTATTPSVGTSNAGVQVVHLFSKTQGPLDPAPGATDFYGDATGSGDTVHVGIRAAGETFAGPGSTPTRSATAATSSRWVAQAVVLERVADTPSANLSWTKSSSSWADGYELTRQVGGGGQVTQPAVPGVATQAVTNGPLVNGTSYTFRLSASRGTWRSSAVAAAPFTPNC
ncbi:hypothetical protein [Blastococcus litoris]|uniref:hypothetical protein n=1 Tax=Blastococcus litoris TaxID=2171622 RepID=UPI000E3085C5|nr:hypothetical protein [Blastococcus litoris]